MIRKVRKEDFEQVYEIEKICFVDPYPREQLEYEFSSNPVNVILVAEEDDKVVHIQVLIVVDRDNIKKIIIGKQGSMLKEIGTRARKDIEEFLGKKVFLETYVKTLKNWRDQERYFVELGLTEENE